MLGFVLLFGCLIGLILIFTSCEGVESVSGNAGMTSDGEHVGGTVGGTLVFRDPRATPMPMTKTMVRDAVKKTAARAPTQPSATPK